MLQHPALPFDVLEAIVNTLAADDTVKLPNVKTFSLTCKSLLHCCRKQIFKTIIIGLPIPMEIFDEYEADVDWTMHDSTAREIPPSRLCWLAFYVREDLQIWN